MYKKSEWTFSEEVASSFEEHVRKSVPFYNRMQDLAVSLSDYFIRKDGVIYDLGSSTGSTLSAIAKRHPDKEMRLIGIDNSEAMVKKAKEHHDNPSIDFIHSSIQSFLFPSQPQMVYSLLTLQFLPIPDRHEVVKRIYESLERGGVFIQADKFYFEQPEFQHIFTHLHYESKQEAGFTTDEIYLKENSLRGVLQPFHLEEWKSFLISIGFHVDVFLRDGAFVGIIAIKP